MSLETAGTKIDSIPVEISYRIIELFSAGLYSSPNKAFEELVSNSYDALAKKVAVFVPSDTSTSDAYMWVCDNGESMDSDGLKLLWKIGSSTKRENESKRERLRIGKFGIGKLATYVLARKLTHVCKTKSGDYLAVTMDYSQVNKGEGTETINLDERKLTLEEAKSLLKPFITLDGNSLVDFDLWGPKAEESWTIAIMTDLKSKASEISEGRLKWVLKTALPVNPNFKLCFNGSQLKSSKLDQTPLKTWEIGKNDKIVEKFEEYTSAEDDEGNSVVNFEHLKNVHGTIELFEDSLVTGKSEKWGRSNGIFLMVRERLVNVTDPLLGMDALSHGTFNRTRIVLHANELDANLTSTRESIKESKPLEQLRQYIRRKFVNDVKAFWDAYKQAEEDKNRASNKLFNSSGSLSRRPLLAMVRKFLSGEISNLIYTEVPRNLTKDERSKLLASLEDDLTSESGIIKDVTSWEIMDPDDPVAKFDLESGKAKVNLLHPFFANFSDEIKTTVPFELIALTEILTEAYLIELGVDENNVRNTLLRRDQLLRQFTFSDRPNAPGVATILKDSLASSTGLEDAVFQAFNNLGFDTTKIGGNGKPDGRAVAMLGYKSEGVDSTYSLVYDAKSTGKSKIKAATAKISTSVRHRNDYGAKYSVVVSRDFEGANDPTSAVNTEAKTHSVTLLRAKDFIKLILLSAPKQLGLAELEGLFESSHTVIETSNWIDQLETREEKPNPIAELLETVFSLQKDDTEPPELGTVRFKMKENYPDLEQISKDDVRTLVQSLERLVPGYISLENEIVSIQAKPSKILDSINLVTSHDVAPEFRNAYIEAFETHD